MMVQFDLEQSILRAWGIVDDLRDIVEGINERGFEADQVATMLTALTDLYELRFDRAFTQFSQLTERNSN